MMQKTCKSAEVQLTLAVDGEKQGQPFDGQEYMKRYLETYMEHGGLFDQVQAAHFAGVTRQRICQLVKAGRLRTISLSVKTPGGVMLIEETIAGNDLRAWMEAHKGKGGRPPAVSRQPVLQAA